MQHLNGPLFLMIECMTYIVQHIDSHHPVIAAVSVDGCDSSSTHPPKDGQDNYICDIPNVC